MIIDGQELPVTITYKNNKHTYFKIQLDGLHVHASHGMPKHLIDTHIKNNFHNFYEKYQVLVKQSYTFSLWGKPYHIRFVKGYPSYKIIEGDIDISHHNIDLGIKYVLRQELIDYILSIKKHIETHLKAFSIKPRDYVYKYYKSKFGAYHKIHDKVYLNTFLATQKKAYVWYVLMHEYAHTVHFHHQKTFHTLLEQLHPNYKVIEKSLKSLVIPGVFHV